VPAQSESAAVARIAEPGHQPEFDARPLPRTIQREISKSITQVMLDGKPRPRPSAPARPERAGMTFHHGLAMNWAPPVRAGPMSVAYPALGYSAPNRAYPTVTHLRALLAHLAFSAAAATVTEAG
jgi:hypothetical protein